MMVSDKIFGRFMLLVVFALWAISWNEHQRRQPPPRCVVTDRQFGYLEPARYSSRILGGRIYGAFRHPEVWHPPMKKVECHKGILWRWVPESAPDSL